MSLQYYSLEELIGLIDKPNGSICLQIIQDSRELFMSAPGSTHNHQAWPGGYWDHITDAMNICVQLYAFLKETGRLVFLSVMEQFELSDALLVLYLHDIEKPWRTNYVDGKLEVVPELKTKVARTSFQAAKLAEYNLELTPNHLNALRYVEGIRDSDYAAGKRIMWPLGALCHCCDILSARAFYDFPFAQGDPWAPGRCY